MVNWYFGKEEAEQLGDYVVSKLEGKTISKRIDLAEEPGGLIYEANKLGIDMWDLLRTLEGLCYQGRSGGRPSPRISGYTTDILTTTDG